MEFVDLKTIIGIYPICNTGCILVHKIDYTEDKILVSLNGKNEEWCDMGEEELGYGFYYGQMFVPFAEVTRFYTEV